MLLAQGVLQRNVLLEHAEQEAVHGRDVAERGERDGEVRALAEGVEKARVVYQVGAEEYRAVDCGWLAR